MREQFIKYWTETVKPVATKCANLEVFNLMKQSEIYTEDCPEFKETADKLKETGIKDFNGVWYIGQMIGAVDSILLRKDTSEDYHDARDKFKAYNLMSQVNSCLNSDSYWTNVWNNDLSSDEAKNLRELASIMLELIRLQ